MTLSDFSYSLPPEKMDLKAIRIRLRDLLLSSERLVMSSVIIPSHLNPRKQMRWLEIFVSWCRWYQIQSPTPADSNRFNYFLKTIEKQNLRKDHYEITRNS